MLVTSNLYLEANGYDDDKRYAVVFSVLCPGFRQRGNIHCLTGGEGVTRILRRKLRDVLRRVLRRILRKLLMIILNIYLRRIFKRILRNRWRKI